MPTVIVMRFPGPGSFLIDELPDWVLLENTKRWVWEILTRVPPSSSDRFAGLRECDT